MNLKGSFANAIGSYGGVNDHITIEASGGRERKKVKLDHNIVSNLIPIFL